MKIWLKGLLIILAILFVLAIVFRVFMGIFWSGGLNFLFPEEITTFESLDGKYTLVFEQMGDPGWPFGSAEVRLTLKDSGGKTLDRVSANVYNDGGDAHSGNIEKIQWGETEVVVTLSSDEHPDQIITLFY